VLLVADVRPRTRADALDEDSEFHLVPPRKVWTDGPTGCSSRSF
jgi:hypothetical protein